MTNDQSGEGSTDRGSGEGLRVTRAVTQFVPQTVLLTEIRKVSVTVTTTVPREVVRQVSMEVTTMRPEVVTECVPVTVTRQVPYTVTVNVPKAVTEAAPGQGGCGRRLLSAGCVRPDVRQLLRNHPAPRATEQPPPVTPDP